MSEVIVWACSICAAAAVCLVCEMLMPKSKISTAVRFALGIFMVGVIILPMGGVVASLADELSDISPDSVNSISSEISLEEDAAQLAKDNIRELVKEEMHDIGVDTEKIEIVTDSDKLSDINGIESVIYISNRDRGKVLTIKNHIKDSLGLDCRIVVIGEDENG